MVPNAPGGDREALRSFTLLQHVRFFALYLTPSCSNRVYFIVAGFAAILVLCLLANKCNHRRTCIRSLYLCSMTPMIRVPPLSTPSKSSHRHPLPILSDGKIVRRDNASAKPPTLSYDSMCATFSALRVLVCTEYAVYPQSTRV